MIIFKYLKYINDILVNKIWKPIIVGKINKHLEIISCLLVSEAIEKKQKVNNNTEIFWTYVWHFCKWNPKINPGRENK